MLRRRAVRLIAGTLIFALAAGPSIGPAFAAPQPVGYRNVTPAQLRAMLGRKNFTLINVHIPYEGEIPGTDMFIPYTDTEARALRALPDKAARIVVYCQTGRMSAITASVLVRLGYTNVFNLDGGMAAWKQAGYPLVMKPR